MRALIRSAEHEDGKALQMKYTGEMFRANDFSF